MPAWLALCAKLHFLTGRFAMVGLEQLIGLNDEIAAILRSKLPLARDVSFLTRNPDSKLSKISNVIASKVGRGETLVSAISSDDDQIPESYRHMIEIGLKADHLPLAIESLATQGRTMANVRDRFRLALVYPSFVCAMAYSLVIFVILHLSAKLQDSADAMQLEQSPLLQSIARARDSAHLWVWIPPLVLIIVWLWLRASSTRNNTFGGFARLVRMMPSGCRTAELSQHASLAELIAALLENGVSVEEAVVLAANAIGDEPIRASARHLADSMRDKAGGIDPPEDPVGIPPLIRWILVTPSDPSSAADSLRVVASNYRYQADEVIEKAGLFYPIIVTVAVAGTVTLAYALLTFVPLIQLITQLTVPHTQ